MNVTVRFGSVRFGCGFETAVQVHAVRFLRRFLRFGSRLLPAPKIGQRSGPLLWPRPWAARAWRSRKGEAFMGGPRLPPTLLRGVARVPLMLVMRAPAGSPARTRKLEISWSMAAKRARSVWRWGRFLDGAVQRQQIR